MTRQMASPVRTLARKSTDTLGLEVKAPALAKPVRRTAAQASVRMLPMKSRYALKALVFLARNGGDGPVLISSIAEAEGIPRKFLEAILLELRNHGVLASRRGKNGGYTLLLPPQQINLGDVIRMLTGPMAPLPCLSKTAYQRCVECPNEGTCAVRLLLADVHAATLRIVDGTTLADLIVRIEAQSSHCDPSVIAVMGEACSPAATPALVAAQRD
jgi:Rrf2 family protein